MRWEYDTYATSDPQDVPRVLQRLDEKGQLGWELVSTEVSGGLTYFYFKRQVTPSRSPV
jgi:hypothetical protein